MVPQLGAHGTVRVRDPHVCPRSLLLPTQVRREEAKAPSPVCGRRGVGRRPLLPPEWECIPIGVGSGGRVLDSPKNIQVVLHFFVIIMLS